MKIDKDQPILVMRVRNYRSYDFIVEHTNMLQSQGQVWMLKVGKKIPFRSLKEIVDAGGLLFLRTAKQQGNKWYVAHMDEFYHGSPTITMKYPEYYLNMAANNDEISLDGTWVKIDMLFEISESLIDRFSLIANDHALKEVINTTRTSFLYVQSRTAIDLHAEGYLKEKSDE